MRVKRKNRTPKEILRRISEVQNRRSERWIENPRRTASSAIYSVRVAIAKSRIRTKGDARGVTPNVSPDEGSRIFVEKNGERGKRLAVFGICTSLAEQFVAALLTFHICDMSTDPSRVLSRRPHQ